MPSTVVICMKERPKRGELRTKEQVQFIQVIQA